MANSHYIVKKKFPKIIFEYGSCTDLKNLLEFSKILKNLAFTPKDLDHSKEGDSDKINIWVLFKENNPSNFVFSGIKKYSFSYPYYASKHTHQENKDDLDRKYCYEVTPKDSKILDQFFKKASTFIKSVGLYNIWLHEFPLNLCFKSNIEVFNFNSCRIDSFPDDFKNLSNLKRISMKYSWIKMPISFANCKNLRKIIFDESCLIDKFPEDIGKCLKLQELIYREPYSFRDYLDFPVQIRARIGITTLPASIGKIPNLTKIYLRDCVNLRSLPEELAHFPLKFIQLHNSAHLIDNETYLPEKIVKFVLIEWYHGDFNFNNFSSRKKNLDFDQIIDNLSLVYESLESNVLSVLISCFREKKIQIIRILEQWIEKSSNITTKKLFLDFVIKISLKIENPNGLLFL